MVLGRLDGRQEHSDMDPNANLQEQERLIAALARTVTDAHRREWKTERRHDRARLRELRRALVEWLRPIFGRDGGGFEPRWHECPRAAAWFDKGIDSWVMTVARMHAAIKPQHAPIVITYGETIRPFGPLTFADRPLPWQVAGLQETASGYGRRLTSRRVAILPDGRERRVYVTCYSNAGTAWIRVAGRTVIVSDGDAI